MARAAGAGGPRRRGGARWRSAGRRPWPASGSCRRTGVRACRRRRAPPPRRGAAGSDRRRPARPARGPGPDRCRPGRRGPCRPPESDRRRGTRCRRRPGRGPDVVMAVCLLARCGVQPHITVPRRVGGGRGSERAVRVRGWPPSDRPGRTRRPTRWLAWPPRLPTGTPGRREPGVRGLSRAGRDPAARRRRRRPRRAGRGSRWSARHRAPGGRDRAAVRRPVGRAARPAPGRGGAGPGRGRRAERGQVPAARQPDAEGAGGGPLQRLAAPAAGPARPAGRRGARAVGGQVVPRPAHRAGPGARRGRTSSTAGRVWATYHPSAAIRFGPNGAPRAALRPT